MTQAFNLSQFANKVNTSGQADLATAVTGTLPQANGGTGTTTAANGELLIGNGSGFTKSTLTAGAGMTITNASGAITLAAAGGGFSNMQVFFSPGTFTTPSTTTRAKITVVGGGGAGGAGGTQPSPFGATPTTGGRGAAGAIAIYVGPVTASTAYPVTVGATAVAAAGNTSSFGALASATGGARGSPGPAAATPVSGGTATGGTLNLPGQPSGSFGFNMFGGQASPLPANPGFGYSSGGTGQQGPAGAAPGTGAPGLVIVEW